MSAREPTHQEKVIKLVYIKDRGDRDLDRLSKIKLTAVQISGTRYKFNWCDKLPEK